MIRLPLAPFHKKHTVYVDTQLVAWKQVATAIRTVALLRESFPDVSLVIAGDGPERQVLEELIEEKTLERHVTLLGNVSKAERLHYLRSADVLFSPAMYEEKPDVLYEAMQYGVPIAASDVPGQREQLAHKKNALILPPGNALASSEALADLFENIALQKKLAQEAKELFEKTFSWNTHCEKLKAIFTRHEPKQ